MYRGECYGKYITNKYMYVNDMTYPSTVMLNDNKDKCTSCDDTSNS